MIPNMIKYSIAAGCILASSTLYADTVSFDEAFAGTFYLSGDSVSYNLTSGDASFPSMTTTTNLATNTGSFTRDAGDGNTFFGTLDFVLGEISPIVPDVYSYQVNYSGNLLITGGTGIFDGATGNGTFTGTDLYFAIFETRSARSLEATTRLAAIIRPSGTAEQQVSWNVTTGDVNAVPIPAAAWLFGSGIMGLAGLRRRSKNNVA